MKDPFFKVILSILCLAVTATWAWTLHMSARVTRCEVRTSAVSEDIREIKTEQRALRGIQTDMWRDLRDRVEAK